MKNVFGALIYMLILLIMLFMYDNAFGMITITEGNRIVDNGTTMKFYETPKAVICNYDITIPEKDGVLFTTIKVSGEVKYRFLQNNKYFYGVDLKKGLTKHRISGIIYLSFKDMTATECNFYESGLPTDKE